MMEFFIIDDVRIAVSLWGGLMLAMLVIMGFMAHDRASRRWASRRWAYRRKVAAQIEWLVGGVYIVAGVMVMVNILYHGISMT